jgi:hypothetical protein
MLLFFRTYLTRNFLKHTVGIAHSVARWVYRSWGSDFNAGSEHNLKKMVTSKRKEMRDKRFRVTSQSRIEQGLSPPSPTHRLPTNHEV